jgi:hypothetical protein
MTEEIKKYFIEDQDAYYIINGIRCSRSVHFSDQTRFKKAKEQSEIPPVDAETIIIYVNDFLKKLDMPKMDNARFEHPLPFNYAKLKEEYRMNSESDIIWFKFTKDGYLGVVACSNDINFDIPQNRKEYNVKVKRLNNYTKEYENVWKYNTSGILVHSVDKSWDESFVLIFPCINIPYGYSKKNIETAIGNYLIEKGVPIIDFYSHNY